MGKKCCFLDIETTGLSYANRNNIIIAYAILCGNELHVEILEDPSKEKELLSNLLNRLRKCKKVYTYNGAEFDLPYIATMCTRHHLDASILYKIEHIDVLRDYVFKKVKLPMRNLDYVAWSLGYSKFDYPIKSMRIPQVWLNYVLNGNSEYRNYIYMRLKYDVEALKYVAERLGAYDGD